MIVTRAAIGMNMIPFIGVVVDIVVVIVAVYAATLDTAVIAAAGKKKWGGCLGSSPFF